jgi:hypothetical protein
MSENCNGFDFSCFDDLDSRKLKILTDHIVINKET